MKSLIAIACTLATIHFTSTGALECFDCTFYDGYKHSDSSCKDQPNASLLKTCEDYPTPLDGEISVCKKTTGILDGQRVVRRECSRTLRESAGKCYDSGETIRIEKRSTNATYGCACSTDECNGASSHQFTYFLLFASFVVYAMFS